LSARDATQANDWHKCGKQGRRGNIDEVEAGGRQSERCEARRAHRDARSGECERTEVVRERARGAAAAGQADWVPMRKLHGWATIVDENLGGDC
jgi:hypothetical protein